MSDNRKLVTLNVAVPPLLKQWVREQVNAGNYSSASEVVRDALRQLQKRTRVTPETPEMPG